jgi:hypothetical protein
MKTVQGDLIFAEIAPVIRNVAVVLLILLLTVPDTVGRKLFCLIRGGHKFVVHPVQLARAVHGDKAVYRTDSCTRRYCGIQRETSITKPLQEA